MGYEAIKLQDQYNDLMKRKEAMDRMINPPLVLKPGAVHCALVGDQITRAFSTVRPGLPKWTVAILEWALYAPKDRDGVI